MKAESTTLTKVTVFISNRELVEFVRKAGIHVPEDVDVDVLADADEVGNGVFLEWSQEHDAPDEQG
jgi:hypothetical protein